jgi:hypothetical protein
MRRWPGSGRSTGGESFANASTRHGGCGRSHPRRPASKMGSPRPNEGMARQAGSLGAPGAAVFGPHFFAPHDAIADVEVISPIRSLDGDNPERFHDATLIERESARRLARLGGTEPAIHDIPRRRPRPSGPR